MSKTQRSRTATSANSRTQARSAPRKPSPTAVQVTAGRRPFLVFITLVGFLTGTSALLLALSRPPLTPDAANTLFAIDAPPSMEVIFDTKIKATPSRWQYIYIHHSKTPAGNAVALADGRPGGLGDHFVIGNGSGAADGEIQIGQRWNQQLSATPPDGAGHIDPACISICLIGDFDRALPTNAQVQHLGQLVSTLQHKLRIPADRVIFKQGQDVPPSPAAIGQYFPATAFKTQLLP